MLIKFLKSVANPYGASKGKVVDVPEVDALSFIKCGYAETAEVKRKRETLEIKPESTAIEDIPVAEDKPKRKSTKKTEGE